MDMKKDGYRHHAAACPVCQQSFPQREDMRPATCSRSCARTLQARVHGPNGWKGGRNRHAAGYIRAKAPEGHLLADKNGYVMEHRLVMESVLGRFLTPDERVHHKNGQRDDNRPENLELWKGAGKKDPAGVRVADAARDLLRSLPPAERAAVLAEFAG